MRLSLATTLVAGLGWLGLAAAHNIQLKAHSRECFHEELHRDDKMTVTFQVGDREFGGSGNLEIDFFVRFLPAPLWGTSLTLPLFRSRILPVTTRHSINRYHQGITLSRRSEMGNIFIASAMSIGRPILRMSHSMCTALFTFRSQMPHLIHSRQKVSRPVAPF